MSPFDVVTIVFVILKLCGVIAWSWWWVFSPTIFGLLFFAIFFGVVASIGAWRK